MKQILCPRCTKHVVKEKDICPECGFHIMEFYEVINNEAIFQIRDFYDAIYHKQKEKALQCLGALRFFDFDNYPFYCAFYHFNNGNLDAAIDLLEKEENSNKKSLFLLADCYAERGYIKKLFDLLRNCPAETFGTIQSLYYNLVVYEKTTQEDCEQIDESYIDSVVTKVDDEVDKEYYYKLNLLYAEKLIRAYEIVDGFKRKREIDPKYLLSENIGAELSYIYNIVFCIGFDCEKRERVLKLINLKNIENDGKLNEYNQEIIEFIYEWLKKDNPFPNRPDANALYLKCLKVLGAWEELCTIIEDNIESVKNIFDLGITDIGTTIIAAYYYAQNSKKQYLKLLNFVETSVIKEKTKIRETKQVVAVYQTLTERGRSALEIAEQLYYDSVKRDNSWIDCGLMSLAYFRIIELELNRHLVSSWINKDAYKSISKTFKSRRNSIVDEKEKKQYESKWSRLLQSFQSISSAKGADTGLELGSLKNFIMLVNENEGDPVAGCLGDKLFQSISNGLANRVKDGTISQIISDENRNKYRNPPAHTRYLPYYIALEARNFVLETLLRLDEWNKEK